MKVAVINQSGNAGKTTISRHLLAPRMNNAPIISFESTNTDGKEKLIMRGVEYGKLGEMLVLADDVVVDIGASNIEDFINSMKEYEGSHEDLDFYVVPTMPDSKILVDTIKTIAQLSALGVPATKIRVVFTKVSKKEEFKQTFSSILQYHDLNKNFVLNPAAVIYVSELFQRIHDTDLMVKDILDDETDYKEKIALTTDSDERVRLSKLLGHKRLAVGLSNELDAVFKSLFS